MKTFEATVENAVLLFKKSIESKRPLLFPTDTIYGLGAPLSSREANLEIYEIKGRPKGKPFPVLIGDISHLKDIIRDPLTDFQKETLKKYWPGPYTFIFNASDSVSSIYTLNGKIAVRLPDLPWLSESLKEVGAVSATSANLSGEDYNGDLGILKDTFSDKVCGILFSITSKQSKPSTIVDISDNSFTILR